MTFPDAHFDLIVEKATFDSTITTLDAGARQRARKMLAEAHRVLRPGGAIFSVSINNPALFQSYYSHPGLEVVTATTTVQRRLDVRKRADANINFYVYVIRKVS